MHVERKKQNCLYLKGFITANAETMRGIIESSQMAAYRAVNTILIQRNWLLGYRIASEEMQGCTVFILFIRHILRFSRRRLENLWDDCRGRIMQHCCRLKINQLVTGMKKKL